MTVTVLPTRSTAQWGTAVQALGRAIPVADHPLVTEHGTTADRMLLDAGHPTRAWANRIAAIAVIAERRADVAPTIERRIAYLDLASAAAALLLLAHDLHAVRPDDAALSALEETGLRTAALI
jgi:hypothetical protein